MSKEKPTVLRKENLGFLVWSPKLDSYFLADKNIEETIEQVLTRKRKGVEDIYAGISTDLKESLIELGFNNEVREINSNLEQKLSAPLTVYFDYTYACNLRCTYCYNHSEDRKITLPQNKIEKVLTEMSANGVMRTHLAGGEPMIYFDCLRAYLETATRCGMNASVNSNGTLLTDKILDLIFDNDVITLTFSLDGHDAKTHDQYRGKGNFDKTRINAKIAVDRKKQKNHPIKLQYKATHFFDTPLEVYAGLIRLAIKDGMDRIQFHNPECSIDHSKGHYSKKEVIEGYYERIIHLEKLKEEYCNQIDIWVPWNPITGCREIGLPGYTGCIGGQELVAIDAKGDIKPCLMNKYGLGNLFSDWNGDFKEFWHNSNKLSDFHKTISRVDPHCTDCNIYSQCRGGRKSRIVVNNRDGNSENDIQLDDFVGYDPYCAKDFLEMHKETRLQPKRGQYIQLNHFKQIFVSHSL